jgi:hypothetical protein
MWRKKKWDKEVGCLRQNVVDALWEPSGKYDVDVWYEYIKEWVRASINTTSSAALS